MSTPLAEQMRPKSLPGFVGQEHLMGKNGPIRKLLENKDLTSMILWGPPGSGKTTLARLVANHTNAEFIAFSAIGGSVAEIRKITAKAKELKELYGRETVLFVDEIHRFNKSQQDAFLPHVEAGTITLIGATTENPGFYVNAPLLSRMKVFKLNLLAEKDLGAILDKTAEKLKIGEIPADVHKFLISQADGDARNIINSVELVHKVLGLDGKNAEKVDLKSVQNVLQQKSIYYDKKSDNHYDTISAYIKSMRNGDIDASLHYLARMLKGGEDPMFIARRMVIFASEDIGNIRPNALVLATSTMQAVHMIVMPESSLLLAQTTVYLAGCPKSIASTIAIGKAMSDIDLNQLPSIPLHLRNAANKVMKELDYGKGHDRYAWKTEKESGQKSKQTYLPDELLGRKYYEQDW